jgi:hypothetical protein
MKVFVMPSWNVLFALILLGIPTFGQNTTGTIVGRITDPTGAVVGGVKVTVQNIGTSTRREILTDASGDYTATLLLPGEYSVSAEHSGFKTELRNGITLQVDQTVRLDMALSVGSTDEKVEVNATALALDTDSASVGQVIDRTQVTELPLNGRSFVNLLFLEVGAVQTGASSRPSAMV